MSLAELEFTACFEVLGCKKFNLYEFDPAHKAGIHGRSQSDLIGWAGQHVDPTKE